MINIKSTRAAFLTELGKPLMVDEIILPETLYEGQVLVKLITSGICGSQLNEISGQKGADKFLPHLLGHEGFAQVLEVGPGVSTVRPMDHVILHWRKGIGLEAKPANYTWQQNKLNAGWVTTFNEHAIVSENRITNIFPKGLSTGILPLLGCALTTALGVLTNDAHAEKTDSLLIFGCGGVGHSLIRIAKFLGLTNIMVVDNNINKLTQIAENEKINTAYFKTKNSTKKFLENFYSKKLPDIAIDTSGNTSAIELSYELTSPQGKVILVGVPKQDSLASFHTLPLHFGKTLKGSHGGNSNPDKDIPFLINQISKKSLDLDNFPLHYFALEDINLAIDEMKNNIVGRVIIKF